MRSGQDWVGRDGVTLCYTFLCFALFVTLLCVMPGTMVLRDGVNCVTLSCVLLCVMQGTRILRDGVVLNTVLYILVCCFVMLPCVMQGTRIFKRDNVTLCYTFFWNKRAQ